MEDKLSRYFSFWFYWAWLIMWRYVNGRFFIFRDAPDWVCIWCTFGDHDLTGESIEVRNVSQQANEEMLARLSKLKRELESAMKDKSK